MDLGRAGDANYVPWELRLAQARFEHAGALANGAAGHCSSYGSADSYGARGARQRSGGVEKYSSIASRQAPEHGSAASSPGLDSRISAATLSAQLMQTPARSIPQPVQLQFDLWDVSPRLSLITPPRWRRRGGRGFHDAADDYAFGKHVTINRREPRRV